MLNVLIVDDEPFIRQGLRVLVDWEAEGFRIIGEASDGLEALEMMEHHQADLIIADIQMPGMGGLQLLKELRESGMNDVHFVILSGYREFSYAQTAMKYNCLDYIIKPINKDDLLAILRSIAQQHEQRCIAEANEEVRDSAMLESNVLPLLVGKYDQINLDYVSSALSLSSKIRYISIELDMSDARLQGRSDENRRSMQRVLYASVKNTLGERSGHVLFDVDKTENCYDVGLIFCDVMATEQGMGEQEFFDWLVERAEAGVECGIVMQVGCEVERLDRLSDSYRSANIAKFMQDFQGDGVLYVADEQNRMQDELSGEAYSHLKARLDDLVAAVEHGGQPEIEAAVDALYRYMGESSMDYRFVSMNINHLLFRLINMAVEKDSHLDQQEAINYIIENAFDKGVMRGSAAHFARFCCEFAEYLRQIESQSAGNILGMVEREIAEKYMTNISLKQLGERFFINSAYLGQMFKKHYGMSFKDYLNTVRINNSVDLLAHTDMKVYEISAAVGYQSVDYFVNKFVAQKGHTPAKFRKNLRDRGNGMLAEELQSDSE